MEKISALIGVAIQGQVISSNRPSQYKRSREAQSKRTIQRQAKTLRDNNEVLQRQGVGKLTAFFHKVAQKPLNQEATPSVSETIDAVIPNPEAETITEPDHDDEIIVEIRTSEPHDYRTESTLLRGPNISSTPVPVIQVTQRTYPSHPSPSSQFKPPPPSHAVIQCLHRIENILRPKRKTGNGYKDPHLNVLFRGRLEMMAAFLRLYQAGGFRNWIKSSEVAATAAGKGSWLARRLREWVRAMIEDENDLPVSQYGRWNSSVLEDEDIAEDIHLHLQGIGKYVSANDIVRYVATDEVKERLKLKKVITERTARNWMRRIGYRWKKTPTGQYKDGHEREDVVAYRQDIFLPAWKEIEKSTRKWDNEGNLETEPTPGPDGRVTVVWIHDESTFHTNDRRKIRWVHISEDAVPQAKGEGASLMFADFVSADYGWLRALDG
jgi:hypothetical protein